MPDRECIRYDNKAASRLARKGEDGGFDFYVAVNGRNDGHDPRDVSEDIANEVLERALDVDENLSEDTKRFIGRHVRPGDKRPPAPSVRRGTEISQVTRKARA